MAPPFPEPDVSAADRANRVRLLCGALVLVVFVGVLVAIRPQPAPRAPADPTEGAALGVAVGLAQPTTSIEADPVLTESTTTSTAYEPQFILQDTPTTTLPLPERPPRDPRAPTPRVQLATLSIPKLNVTVPLLEGITLTAIDQGTGHWPGTPTPGGLGNMVVAGHRTLYQKPFNRLDELDPGDKVYFDTSDGKRFVYQVRGTMIVPANNIGLASQFDSHTATLFACHPKGQATHRIVAKLMLLGDNGQPVDPPDKLPPMDVGNRSTDDTLMIRDDGDSGGGGDGLGGGGQ